jgi:hypothetical protein
MSYNDIKNIVIIIGGQKCGSTLLYDILAQSNEVCECFRKEPRYFTDMKRNRAGLRYMHRQGQDAVQKKLRYCGDYIDSSNYFSLWPKWNPKKHKFAIEASVDYTSAGLATYCANDVVAKRILNFKKYNKVNIKLIYIARDPVPRIRSSYIHNYITDKHLEAPLRLPKSYVEKYMLEYTNYLKILDSYSKYFSNEDMLVLNFDEVIAQKQEACDIMAKFLRINKF